MTEANFENQENSTEIPSSSGYAVKLSVFEGPLDLLLHLIRSNEVEITDIPIAQIGEQYLAYLELMQELEIDLAAEYLLMAATLAWIKSRMLLPVDVEDSEEGEAEDPRAELVARLLEYQRFKEAAEELGERSRLGRDVYAAAHQSPERPPEAEREIEVGIFQLISALKDVLDRAQPEDGVHEVLSETITVRDRMRAVLSMLRNSESVEFLSIFQEGPDDPLRRPVIVATFLAILELARLGALHIYQGVDESSSPQGPIRLRSANIDNWPSDITELM